MSGAPMVHTEKATFPYGFSMFPRDAFGTQVAFRTCVP